MSFDTEKFIRKIENRKALWDLSAKEYSDRDVKRRRWEEITNLMYKSLQQRWKNIRTCFTRELKRRAGAKSGSTASRKSPYIYFDQLQFLRKTVENTQTQISLNKSYIAETDDECCNIPTLREERERKQESDSDRLFMLSLLEDFKNIPKHRKLSTRMELIDVIKRA
ncbi:hypothetical protein ABEB36_015139 [Hypothenemus hampei]|uniref:MADF domain-containing protein n=1 Tax=Hypothenemus hampei TaxID=57062 RepID=A0ABD1E0H3_HYPHA